MFKVVKRDGEVAEFNLEKISDAIAKAFDATEKQYNGDMTGLLAFAHFLLWLFDKSAVFNHKKRTALSQTLLFPFCQ